MKWWQIKVRGWTVPFWFTETPVYGKKITEIGFDKIAESVRMQRQR
jgi:hypothetical protein